MPIVAITCMVVFVPWILLRAWIVPLPDTIQEQANDAIEYGFDGIIVYVDEADKAPEFYTAGWKNRENRNRYCFRFFWFDYATWTNYRMGIKYG